MLKFDLTRRQFVNGSLASLGLYGITGLSNFVLADEPREFEEVTKFLRTGRSNIPYVTLTEEGPAYPVAEVPWLSDFTSVGGKGRVPAGQLVFLFGQILNRRGGPCRRQLSRSGRPIRTAAICTPSGQGKGAQPGLRILRKGQDRREAPTCSRRSSQARTRSSASPGPPIIHVRIRHPDHGILTTQVYFEGKQDDSFERRPVWQGHPSVTRDRLILPKQSPKSTPT